MFPGLKQFVLKHSFDVTPDKPFESESPESEESSDSELSSCSSEPKVLEEQELAWLMSQGKKGCLHKREGCSNQTL